MENKYNFNAYDTVVALAVTQYLKTQAKPKTFLRNIMEPKVVRLDAKGTLLQADVDGEALADLLDRAMAWARDGLKASDDSLQEALLEGVKTATEDFNGKAYVQSMDAGFLEYLWDLSRS